MTNFDKNIRTLIVCFVIAIFGLVPLRFVEIANDHSLMIEKQQVLGVMKVNEKKEIDLNKRCLNYNEILEKIGVVQVKLNAGNLTEEEIDSLLSEVQQLHAVRCN